MATWLVRVEGLQMTAQRLFVAGALMALASGAAAQPDRWPPPQAPATTASTVTVTAPRLQQVPDLV
jgi:hypothetical protein